MNSQGISYLLQQSPRTRRLTIRVDARGQVIVTAPLRFPKYRVAEFVESARDWIVKQKTVQIQKPILLSTTTVLYFGKEYSVKVSQKMDGTVKLGKEVIIVSPLSITSSAVLSLLSTWLKSRAIEYVTTRVYVLSKQMNLSFKNLAFKQQKTRWGSCSSQKNLNFNWKLIHAPKDVIDYVIIHELSHLEHMNHGKNFWELVARFDPDHPHHRRWLERYGSTED
ncbi:MAG: SprT family zinc-dependent metalloprotease [Candidatus Woesebacteria bacterium]